jgi:hypothetical protein
MNLGLRFDWFIGHLDEQSAPAGRWVPARTFPEIKDVPNWKDLDPRLGVSWDVFGNGKTAIKGSISRYVSSQTNQFVQSINPMTAGAGATDTRTWTDLNRDGVPQANELGPSTNVNFGLPVFAVRPDESLRTGWGVRPYNWEYNAQVQQELLPGLAANVGFYHRRYGNLTWTHNRALSLSDYAPFTISNPLGGEPVTLYNLNPAKRGIIDQVIEFAPGDEQIFDGLDVTVTGKFGRGGIVNSGAQMGRTQARTCTTSDPNTLRFCDVSFPFMGENAYKVIVAYPLPYGIQASGVFQSFAGPRVLALYTVTSAIAGLTLTNGSINPALPATTGAGAGVLLNEPGSLYGERSNRLDLRVTKVLRTGRARIEPIVELFNVFNASPVLNVNTTYGPVWQAPTATAAGRMVKLGLRAEF